MRSRRRAVMSLARTSAEVSMTIGGVRTLGVFDIVYLYFALFGWFWLEVACGLKQSPLK